jgi:hypothetical protein
MEQTLLNVLLVISGGCLVLDTKQLSKAIGMNYTTISEMRSLGEFPIQHILRGKRPVYPVQNVVSYLMGETQQSDVPVAKKSSSKKPGYKIGSSGLPDMSRLTFMNGLMNCAEQLEESAKKAKAQLQVQIAREELDCALPQKEVKSSTKTKL